MKKVKVDEDFLGSVDIQNECPTNPRPASFYPCKDRHLVDLCGPQPGSPPAVGELTSERGCVTIKHKSCVFDCPHNLGQRLDVLLCELLDIKRAQAQKRIAAQNVLVNGVLKKSSYKLRANDTIELLDDTDLKECARVLPQDIPLDIIFEDEYLLVVNKPKNMLTHPTSFECQGTLVNALLYHTKGKLSDIGDPLRRGIVHRLDKNTPGLLVVAKTNEAHENLAEQIRDKKATRRYLAVALGEIYEDEGTIDKPISRSLKESVKMSIDEFGKEARTHYRVLERFCGATFLELELETGRTHQIRVHLSSINHPIFGDELYGAKGFKGFSKIKTTGQVLQSTYLSFTHPKNSEIMEFRLDVEHWDNDLKKVLKFFRTLRK